MTKKDIIKMVLKTLIYILTSVVTTLGVSSCIAHEPEEMPPQLVEEI